MGSVLRPDEWDVPICYDAMGARGISLGHGGLVALPEGTDFAARRARLARVHGRRVVREVHAVPGRLAAGARAARSAASATRAARAPRRRLRRPACARSARAFRRRSAQLARARRGERRARRDRRARARAAAGRHGARRAAQRLGIAIPTLCHLPGHPPDGGCRLCLVEVEGARATGRGLPYTAARRHARAHPRRRGSSACAPRCARSPTRAGRSDAASQDEPPLPAPRPVPAASCAGAACTSARTSRARSCTESPVAAPRRGSRSAATIASRRAPARRAGAASRCARPARSRDRDGEPRRAARARPAPPAATAAWAARSRSSPIARGVRRISGAYEALRSTAASSARRGATRTTGASRPSG